jgi:hypothetical protein
VPAADHVDVVGSHDDQLGRAPASLPEGVDRRGGGVEVLLAYRGESGAVLSGGACALRSLRSLPLSR